MIGAPPSTILSSTSRMSRRVMLPTGRLTPHCSNMHTRDIRSTSFADWRPVVRLIWRSTNCSTTDSTLSPRARSFSLAGSFPSATVRNALLPQLTGRLEIELREGARRMLAQSAAPRRAGIEQQNFLRRWAGPQDKAPRQ